MNLYSTSALVGLIATLERPSSFLLDLYFRAEQTFDTEEVYFDKIDRARRLAPFVSPKVAGKAERARGYATRTFTPAYVKPKHLVEPSKALKRAPGENLGGGQLSAAQRFEMAVADNLMLEDEQITRREAWMASELLRTGSVTVEGEDYPTQVVDLGRHNDLTVTLADALRWGESGVSPMVSIRTWAALVASKSGAMARNVVMDPMAALIFQTDPEVRAVLDNRRQTSGAMELSPLGGGFGAGDEAVYLGSIGQFDFWQYQDIYTDASGVEAKMMPDYTVILGSPAQAEGTRCYGAIQDTKAQLRPMSRFPKMWDTDDPAVTTTMTQSAPLPVLGRPDAVLCATVR